MLHQIMDIENGWNDNDDGIADGWTRLILVEKKTVWSRDLYIEDVTARGLDPDVGDDDDAVGFSGVIRGGVVPDNIAQDETMPGDAGETMPGDAHETMHADAPETWRNELVALKGQMEKMFSELNMKIEGLGTRVSSIESALRLEREADDYNCGFDDYNPGFEEVQPAEVQPGETEEVQPDHADEVQPGATIGSTEAKKAGAEEVQSGATVVQPDAEQVQPGATVVQPDAEQVQPDAEQVQPGATEVQPDAAVTKELRTYERKRKRAAEVPPEASSDVPAQATQKVQSIGKTVPPEASSDVPPQATEKIKIIGKKRGSTIVIRSPVGTRQRHKILEGQKKD